LKASGWNGMVCARVRIVHFLEPYGMLKISIILVLAALAAGCVDHEVADSGTAAAEEAAPAPAPAPAPGGTTTAPASGDGSSNSSTNAVDPAQAEWDAIRWATSQGPSAKGAVQVMSLQASISSDGRFVNFTWNGYPWSGGGNELAHFFVWDGARWSGGKFDWIRDGGQATKELSNIRNGYNNLRAPPAGSRVAFAWTNEEGTERSNLSVTTWR
jgi:hypothetical protein